MGEPALQQPDPPPFEPPRPAVTYSEAFWRAMATLPNHCVLEDIATRALMTWWRIASARPPEPGLETPDGALRFTWSFEDMYLHLDVLPNGYEWFFAVDATCESAGTDGAPEPSLSDEFFRCLATLRQSHPA